MRKVVALALALSLLGGSLAGCSQPIDTGSSIPPQSQPFVAVLALIALGIGITAYHHHSENQQHGGGPSSTITPPAAVFGVLFTGYRASALAVDSFDAAIGVLETPTVSGTAARFALLSGTSAAFYTLPSGYLPTAVAVDPNGNDWFVDATGHIQGCDSPATSVTTCTTTGLTVATASDGLGSGARSIAVDQFNVFDDVDAGGGSVKWFALNLSAGTPTTSSYQSTSHNGLYSAENVEATTTGASAFTIFHVDGTSDLVTVSPAAEAPNFTFIPVPLVAPSDVVQAVDLNAAFYATTGSTSGTYRLTRYENLSDTGTGSLTTTTITIANDGQTGAPSSEPWSPPLTSIQADANNNAWGIDAAGRIVQFGQF